MRAALKATLSAKGDCPNLTEWQRVLLRFYDLIGWESASGPTLGWNDVDSLEVGNGATDGITNTEQQTAMTLWAMANAPLYLGGDLTNLTIYGKQLLTNNEVLGGNAQSTVTFDNVVVPAIGTYQMEIDYMTQGQRSFFISVNGNTTQELDLNGYSFGMPTSTTIQVPLQAGSNQIEFSNPSNYAPNLDSIIISPPTVFSGWAIPGHSGHSFPGCGILLF